MSEKARNQKKYSKHYCNSKTINIELQNEQDQEISSMLSQQKEIFNKILVQKQTG